jgi:hypothetical protein
VEADGLPPPPSPNITQSWRPAFSVVSGPFKRVCFCGSGVCPYEADVHCAEGSRTDTCGVKEEVDREAGCPRDPDHRGVAADHAIAGYATEAGTAKETDRFSGRRTARALRNCKTIQNGERIISLSPKQCQELIRLLEAREEISPDPSGWERSCRNCRAT